VLGVLRDEEAPRDALFGYYGSPGTPRFKIMVRQGDWKYIFLANGGYEQLFDVVNDPGEVDDTAERQPEKLSALRALAVAQLDTDAGRAALDGTALRAFAFERRPDLRIYQFDRSRGVKEFPKRPQDVLS
jgi:choline-sulfatase